MNYHQWYFSHKHDHHPSKLSAFPNICSCCGKPLRRNSKNKHGFICNKCGPQSRGQTTETRQSACYYCSHKDDCDMRVSLGIWVRCETPDFADLERLRIKGGLGNEELLRELEKALDGCGNRQVLEAAISQSAPQVYQSITQGAEGQMSIGIRVKS